MHEWADKKNQHERDKEQQEQVGQIINEIRFHLVIDFIVVYMTRSD